MRAIFISYRRDDTEGQAGRLFQDLSDAFGADMVFMDVTAIEPGIDFRKAIEKNTASCGVLLALIGRNWLSAADEAGTRRLDNPNDFVRLETVSALRRDIPVVPVLVHGARMPRADELPDDLKDLAFRNGVEITHARWESDVQVLIKALRPHVERAARSGDGADAPISPPQALVSPTPQAAPAPAPAPTPPSAAQPSRPPRPEPAPNRWKMPLAGLAAVLVLGGGWAGYGSWQEAQKREQAQRLIDQQRAEAERAAAQKAEADRAAAEKAAQEKAAADKRAADKREADKRAADKRAAEKREADRQEAIRLAAEQATRDALRKRQMEEEAERERDRERLRQQQLEEERRRLAATREAQIRAHRDGICVSGFVWREARPGDKVCVTPQIRAQAAGENRAASMNRQPGGGAYGPNTCKQGFVWREAFSGDVVCVVPASRTQAARDNALAASRVVPLPN